MSVKTAAKPAVISKEFYPSIRKAGLYDSTDMGKIAELTREHGLKKGGGYSARHIRNFLVYSHTTTEEVLAIITGFYKAKKEMRDRLMQSQQDFIQELNEAHSVHITGNLS